MSEKKGSKLGGFLKDNKEVVTGVVGSIAKGALKGIGKNLGSYLSGFKQGGFKCLGKQAFHQGDLQEAYRIMDIHISSFPNTPEGVAGILNFLSESIPQWMSNVNQWKSPCSKQNGVAYIQTIQERLAKIDKSAYSTTKKIGMIHGHNYEYDFYTYTGGDVPDIGYTEDYKGLGETLKGEDTGGSESVVGSLAGSLISGSLVDEHGNLLEDIDPAIHTPGFIGKESVIEELELVGRKRDPSYNIGIGGRTGDGTDWNISVGKEPREDNTMKYLLLGLLGLVAYKVLFDKK